MLQFETDKKEFGEIYHLLAAARICLKQGVSISINFNDSEYGKEFFHFLDVDVYPPIPGIKKTHLAETSNIILHGFYADLLKDDEERIEKESALANWEFKWKKLCSPKKKLLIWQRDKCDHEKERNSTVELLKQLLCLCSKNDTQAVIEGTRNSLESAEEIGKFYCEDDFFNSNSIAKQLWFINRLFTSCNVIASVGMMSGALDGPAMIYGHKTVFLARHKDATPRMRKVSESVPNLIWLPIEYQGKFTKLTTQQIDDLEKILWPK
jgi:hypothetical protein